MVYATIVRSCGASDIFSGFVDADNQPVKCPLSDISKEKAKEFFDPDLRTNKPDNSSRGKVNTDPSVN